MGEFLDEDLVQGADAVDLALLDTADSRIKHLQGTRHFPDAEEGAFDAVDRGWNSVSWPASNGAGLHRWRTAVSNGLVEGE